MFYMNLQKLLKELNIESPLTQEALSFSFDLMGSTILLENNEPGISLSTALGDAPKVNLLDFYTKLLRGNFMGQATRKASLGLSEDGNTVLLTASIPIIRSYQEFKDNVEDFVNTVSFWKKEIE